MTVSISGTNGLIFNDASTQNTSAFTGGFAFRNRIINGAMVIDQRNAGASVILTTSTYTVDRFRCIEDSDGGMTGQQDSSAPEGFTNSLKITTTTADASLTGTQFCSVEQFIEGHNVADLGWGTANAKTVTLSFWVRSSLTGTFGGALHNSAHDRSYPFTYSISVADTWEYKTITISGDTSGTWLKTTGRGIAVRFGLGVGSTYSGTAGAWAAGTFISATGAVSVIGTLNATWYITGVQLEKGSTATSFDYRPYSTELQLCQRYLPAITLTGGNPVCSAYITSTTTAVGIFKFYVTPRTPPTGITATAASGFSFSSAANFTGSAIAFTDASPVAGKFILTISGGTAGQGGYIFGSNGAQILFTGCEL